MLMHAPLDTTRSRTRSYIVRIVLHVQIVYFQFVIQMCAQCYGGLGGFRACVFGVMGVLDWLCYAQESTVSLTAPWLRLLRLLHYGLCTMC